MTMTELARKLADAETKQQTLLARMNAIDAELSTLTPSDPKRAALKSEKAEILPRYRGAKTHAKNLRRALNSTAQHARDQAVADIEADDETVEDVDLDAMHTSLYAAIVRILDRAARTPPVRIDGEGELRGRDAMLGAANLNADDKDALEDFAAWYEHEHDVEVES